jgi:hypothetical protein
LGLPSPKAEFQMAAAAFFQYVFRPSGGVVNPNDPVGLARIKDAAIFGLTTTLKYRSSEGR